MFVSKKMYLTAKILSYRTSSVGSHVASFILMTKRPMLLIVKRQIHLALTVIALTENQATISHHPS